MPNLMDINIFTENEIPEGPLSSILEEIVREYISASIKHGSFNSVHEGYAVLLEEIDELWDEVRKQSKDRNIENIRRECIQIATMAIRFIKDICEK